MKEGAPEETYASSSSFPLVLKNMSHAPSQPERAHWIYRRVARFLTTATKSESKLRTNLFVNRVICAKSVPKHEKLNGNSAICRALHEHCVCGVLAPEGPCEIHQNQY